MKIRTEKVQKHDEFYKTVLPCLKELTEEASIIIKNAEKKRSHLSTFSQMAYGFSISHKERFESIILLAEAGKNHDAAVIARTMLEGSAILLWTQQEKESRSKSWRDYICICDWQLMRVIEKHGESIEKDHKLQVESKIDKVGYKYLKNKYKNEYSKAIDIPKGQNPFYRSWHNSSVHKIFLNLEAEKVYDLFYHMSSQWVHWSPAAIRAVLMEREEADNFEDISSWESKGALMFGFAALIESLLILDDERHLGFNARLKIMKNCFNKLIDNFIKKEKCE